MATRSHLDHMAAVADQVNQCISVLLEKELVKTEMDRHRWFNERNSAGCCDDGELGEL